jgi:hypothetical protein
MSVGASGCSARVALVVFPPLVFEAGFFVVVEAFFAMAEGYGGGEPRGRKMCVRPTQLGKCPK